MHFFLVLQVLEILGGKFGTERNKKNFKLLPSYIRVIQGDGISYETLGAILENMKKHEWSAENLVFGSGGALLQRLDRDTQKCAYKCSYAVCCGKEVQDLKYLKIGTCPASQKLLTYMDKILIYIGNHPKYHLSCSLRHS